MIPRDEISENRLMELHPMVRFKALSAYREAVKITPVGIHPFITEGLRSFKRSDELYDQGRTKPGKIVTNARAGQSMHNYGLAFDFVIQILPSGKLNWKVDKNWMKVVEVFKRHGFSWGGDWRSLKDYPHFEMNFGKSWQQLFQLYNTGKTDSAGYVIL